MALTCIAETCSLQRREPNLRESPRNSTCNGTWVWIHCVWNTIIETTSYFK